MRIAKIYTVALCSVVHGESIIKISICQKRSCFLSSKDRGEVSIYVRELVEGVG